MSTIQINTISYVNASDLFDGLPIIKEVYDDSSLELSTESSSYSLFPLKEIEYDLKHIFTDTDEEAKREYSILLERINEIPENLRSSILVNLAR